jgi:hypothetical protein
MMSFDAMRTVVEMRRAGRLPGGTTLLVLLMLADRANRKTAEVTTSVRHLAGDAGVHYSQVSRALSIGRERGAIAVVTEGRGRRPTVYRFALFARPEDNAKLSTGLPEGNANGSVALHVALPSSTLARPLDNATVALQQQEPVPGFKPDQPGAERDAKTPADAALALMVGVETRIEKLRGNARRPAAVATTIKRRLAGTFGARLAGMVAEGLSPERAAAAALLEDGVGGTCPACGALNAKPITEEAKCPRRRSCPYFVGAEDEVLL